MGEDSNFFGLLRVNGIDENSSLEKIDSVLTTLKYGATDRQQAIEYLRTRGWLKGAEPRPEVSVKLPLPSQPYKTTANNAWEKQFGLQRTTPPQFVPSKTFSPAPPVTDIIRPAQEKHKSAFPFFL